MVSRGRASSRPIWVRSGGADDRLWGAAVTLRSERIPETALEWHRAGRGVALVTVLQTWGSAPRRAGSQMVVAGDGTMAGSVSGGCVEAAVVLAAQEALLAGASRVLEFGVTDDDAFAAGLACGGSIRLLVEPVGAARGLPLAVLAELVAARVGGQAVAVEVDPVAGGHRLLLSAGAAPELAARFRADQSGMTEAGRFIAIHNPALRLIVVGAVHIAQTLVPMARLAGFDPVLIDPRSSFASAARFPGEVLLDDWPDAAIAQLAPDARSAVVTLTHDSKLDDPAIMAALASGCFYLGCLGSQRTHAKRLERLRAAGVPETALARIHAPVGLDIGARTPAEIAVAVLAEIVRCLRNAPAEGR